MPDTRLPKSRAGDNSRKSVTWSAVPEVNVGGDEMMMMRVLIF